MIIQHTLMTPVGLLYLTASDQGLMRVAWTKDTHQIKEVLITNCPSCDIITETKHQLNEYFMKKRKTFDIPLLLKGTDFQIKVWKELQKIPLGRTISYKTLAQQVNSPDASQAVGNANGRNPLCIIVPCHRVISTTGGLSGFIAGQDVKRKLLEFEGGVTESLVQIKRS